ncbi:hypothetical protein [Microbacterium aurantiacum]|uniref:Uncharacterized protein n=1 Tax=Microbacterium aurantiacum TaxID=162393 RepID=A0AAJ2HHY5_9MICO|nr:hypothetical protein [Microbacterium aurantiacum]MDS0244383.1 hypothetical protein [Microbacterium aurantiacum]
MVHHARPTAEREGDAPRSRSEYSHSVVLQLLRQLLAGLLIGDEVVGTFEIVVFALIFGWIAVFIRFLVSARS